MIPHRRFDAPAPALVAALALALLPGLVLGLLSTPPVVAATTEAEAAGSAAALRGRVVDADGVPLADLEVTAMRDGEGSAPIPGSAALEVTTTTGPDGRFALDPLPPGSWRVRVRRGPESVGLDDVRVPGPESSQLELVFGRPATYRGRVLVDGEPLAGGRLTLTARRDPRSGGGVLERLVSTDADGFFAVDLAPRRANRPFNLVVSGPPDGDADGEPLPVSALRPVLVRSMVLRVDAAGGPVEILAGPAPEDGPTEESAAVGVPLPALHLIDPSGAFVRLDAITEPMTRSDGSRSWSLDLAAGEWRLAWAETGAAVGQLLAGEGTFLEPATTFVVGDDASRDSPLVVRAPARAGSFDPARLGAEIVTLVEDGFLDADAARAWAERHRDLGRGAPDPAAFAGRVTAALAELETSHTAYFRPDDPRYWGLLAIFESYLERDPRRPGIGLVPVEIDGRWFVERVFPDSPAAAAGLVRGDELLAADGRPFEPVASFVRDDADDDSDAADTSETGDEANGEARLREPAAAVELTVRRRPGEPPRTLSVEPRLEHPKELWLAAQGAGTEVIERPVDGRDEPVRVGYAPLYSCAGPEHAERLRQAFDGSLAGAEALVVDLRGGWGGCNASFVSLFDPAVPTLTRLPRAGGDDGGDDGDNDDAPVIHRSAFRGPVVVLIDAGSRSGKEMVTRALQRSGRALVMGETSAGAVVAGRPSLLSDGSLLFLAVADVRLDGERLEGVGVVPDRPVAGPLPHAAGADPQRDAALDEAARRVVQGAAAPP